MAVDNVALFQAIYKRLRRRNYNIRVVAKKTLWIHRVINTILNIVYPKERHDAYMQNYNTSFWRKIAMALRHGDDPKQFGNWRTLCHEWDHMEVEDKWGRFIFSYCYLWPISQGVLLLLTCWLPVFWASGWHLALWIPGWAVLGGLHFIPQLPDPWRKRWEFRAYSISMHLYNLVHGYVDAEYITALVGNFHSMMYYIMAPNEKKIRAELEKLAIEITGGNSPVRNRYIVKVAEEEYRKARMPP